MPDAGGATDYMTMCGAFMYPPSMPQSFDKGGVT